MNKVKELIIGFIFLFGMVILYKTFFDNDNAFKAYSLISKGDEVSLIISSIRNTKGASLIVTEHGDSVSIGIHVNPNYETTEMWRFLRSGDSLRKKADSDTIWVRRNKDEFYFVKY
ncbi:MAG: hypothetical protein RH948_19085 [Cyclobacteriaceae bacterium]